MDRPTAPELDAAAKSMTSLAVDLGEMLDHGACGLRSGLWQLMSGERDLPKVDDHIETLKRYLEVLANAAPIVAKAEGGARRVRKNSTAHRKRFAEELAELYFNVLGEKPKIGTPDPKGSVENLRKGKFSNLLLLCLRLFDEDFKTKPKRRWKKNGPPRTETEEDKMHRQADIVKELLMGLPD